MKTLTVELNDSLFELLETLSRKTGSPKRAILERALLLYKKELERQELLKNLVESAEELSKDPQNLKEIKELEGTVTDGID